MEGDGRNQLTHSRMTSAKSCLRRHWYAYEFGIRKDRTTGPLRMGSAFHHALEELSGGVDLEFAINSATADYEHMPPWCQSAEDMIDWAIEGEIVKRLIAGYHERWGPCTDEEVVAAEVAFDLPLVNPETGRPSPIWRVAGKVDKIVRLADGRLMIGELKTAGDDLSPESDFWKRLRIDQQISLYASAARRMGHDVKGIVYDVTRKPLIRPRPLTQADTKEFLDTGDYFGEKFITQGNPLDGTLRINNEAVVVELGATPKATKNEPNPQQKFAIRETVTMYGARIAEDMRRNPEWYFCRKEIARVDADLAEAEWELWQIAGLLRECGKAGRWPRNTASCLRPYKCEFWELCTGGYDTSTGVVPSGYRKLDYVHPELVQPVAAEF